MERSFFFSTITFGLSAPCSDWALAFARLRPWVQTFTTTKKCLKLKLEI